MRSGPTRGSLTGAVISGVAGAAWAAWGASDLPAGGTIVTVAGVVVAAAIVAGAVTFRRRLPEGERGSMFCRRGYWIVVVLEVGAIVAGNRLLIAFGQAGYVIAWTAFVVGVHFLAFGRLFAPVYHVIGWAMVASAVIGATIGLLGGSIVPVTGLLCAVVLLTAGARSVGQGSRAVSR